MLRCVRPSIRFCLLSCDVRSKGEAFPSRRCKLKKFNIVQPKTSIILLFIREMLRPYKSGRITREPDAVKGNRLSSRDRASGIVSRHGCRASSKFLVPNTQFTHSTLIRLTIIRITDTRLTLQPLTLNSYHPPANQFPIKIKIAF